MTKKGNGMHKKLLIATICILTTKILVDASANAGQSAFNFNFRQQPAAQSIPKNQQLQILQQPTASKLNKAIAPINMIQDLATMQQIYAYQANNIGRALYISSVLDNDANNITIQQKIAQAENLLKIINAQKTLYSSWWPTSWWITKTDQIQKKWLEEQKDKIDAALYLLHQQSRSFGVNMAWKAVKWTSIYLGVAMMIYATWHAIYQARKASDPKANIDEPNFATIATLPPAKLYEIAKWSAVNGTAAIQSQYVQDSFNFLTSTATSTAKNVATGTGKVLTSAKDIIIGDKNSALAYAAGSLIEKERNKVVAEKEKEIKNLKQNNEILRERLENDFETYKKEINRINDERFSTKK